MKVGNLIVDKEHPNEGGMIVYKDEYGDVNAYRVLTLCGHLGYFSKEYIENDCEVISESRRYHKAQEAISK